MPWQARESFHWLDYVVFSVVLIISLFIGSITAFIGKKQTTKDEFVGGGKSMSVVPSSLSMVMAFVSAILVLGGPAEMYGFGTMYFMINLSLPIGCALAAQFFVPLLYPLNLISCYEYLELRFNSRAVKVLASAFLVSSQIIYIGIATFSPSTALEQATGFPTWASIICVGVVTTVYSSLGGIRGTVWGSVFQGFILFGGVLLISIGGTIYVGGFSEMWRLNEEWGRIEFFDFNPDPTIRNTFWTLVIGGGISGMSTYGTSHASVQRYCAMPTQRKAKECLYWNIPFAALLTTVTCWSGVAMFAYFALIGCDPLSGGGVENANQLMPLFVMQTMAWPGFPGLFVSTLFAGSLSTVAACLSAMASCTWEDFLKWKWNHLSDRAQTTIIKGLVFVYGILGTGMAFVTQLMGGHVMQASASFVGAAMAPLLGLFLLGGLFPWANWIGAIVGAVFGLAVPMWISTGAYLMQLPADFLPMPTENCTKYEPGPTVESYERSNLEMFYSISYLWYPAVGMATTVITGLLVSLLTGVTKSEDVPKKYLIPFFDRLFCCFPNKWRASCRCGYTEDEADQEEIIETNFSPEFKTQTSYVECPEYGLSSKMNGSGSGVSSNPPGYWDMDVSTVSNGNINPAYSKEHGTRLDHLGRLSTTF